MRLSTRIRTRRLHRRLDAASYAAMSLWSETSRSDNPDEGRAGTRPLGELAPVLWEILKDIDALRDETLELARHANRKEEP